MIAAEQSAFSVAAPALLVLWAVFMVVVFVGTRVTDGLVRRLSGGAVWVLVCAVAVCVVAAVVAALAFSWFWLAVVVFVSILLLGFSAPVLVSKAGERVFADRRPPEERVVAIADDGATVTEADEDAEPSRDAVAFEAVLREEEDELHPEAR